MLKKSAFIKAKISINDRVQDVELSIYIEEKIPDENNFIWK